MRKMLARLSLIAVGLIASVVVVQAPASAAFSDCGNGLGCVWTGGSGSGSKMNIAVGTYGVGTCHNFSQLNGWDNVVSSARNIYGAYGSQQLWLMMWTGYSCTGTGYGVAPNTSVTFGYPYDNAFSSFKIVAV